jgi:hypothetical protein
VEVSVAEQANFQVWASNSEPPAEVAALELALPEELAPEEPQPASKAVVIARASASARNFFIRFASLKNMLRFI